MTIKYLVIFGDFAEIWENMVSKRELALLSAKVRICFDTSTVLCDKKIYLSWKLFRTFHFQLGFFLQRFGTYAVSKIDNSAKGGLTQFWELLPWFLARQNI